MAYFINLKWSVTFFKLTLDIKSYTGLNGITERITEVKGFFLGGVAVEWAAVSSPPIFQPTHPYIRKTLALRGLIKVSLYRVWYVRKAL